MSAPLQPASGLPRQSAPRGNLRPFARAYARERRLGRRLAFGLTPAQAARVEGIEAAEVERLLADPGFAGLVDEYRALDALPDEERRRVLTNLARNLVQEAIASGDLGAALFVLREEACGRDPARTLADGVIAAHRRPVRAPAPTLAPRPATAAAPPASPPDLPGVPACAGDRAASRIAARLREAVRLEHATLRRAAAHDADRAGTGASATGAPVRAAVAAPPAPPAAEAGAALPASPRPASDVPPARPARALNRH